MQRLKVTIFVLVLLGGGVVFAKDATTQLTSGAAVEVLENEASIGQNKRIGDIEVEQADGKYLLNVKTSEGIKQYTPEQFAASLYQQQNERHWLFGLLNITTWFGVAWVGLGLLGQVLFTGRMIVQWVVSEKKKRSVIPVAFWWMSLTGATMLIIYFIWRQDIVGVLGQATGWFVYVRNLRFIYSSKYGGKKRKQQTAGNDTTD